MYFLDERRHKMAIKVTLLTHTPNPEKTVAMAAKLCYSPSGIEDISKGLTEEKTDSFINMLADLGHASPTEHASFTFGIEGISRACSHQLVRHRIASYSQQSQRYVDGSNFEFVTPPAIAENKEALEAYNVAVDMQAKAYKKIRNALTAGYIKEYLNNNVDGTDEEITEKFKSENKSQYNTFVKRLTRTLDLFFLTPQQPKLYVLLTHAVCKTFLLIAVATEHSGKFGRLPNKCFYNALR